MYPHPTQDCKKVPYPYPMAMRCLLASPRAPGANKTSREVLPPQTSLAARAPNLQVRTGRHRRHGRRHRRWGPAGGCRAVRLPPGPALRPVRTRRHGAHAPRRQERSRDHAGAGPSAILEPIARLPPGATNTTSGPLDTPHLANPPPHASYIRPLHVKKNRYCALECVAPSQANNSRVPHTHRPISEDTTL